PIDFTTDVQAVRRVPTKRKSGVKPIIVQFSNRQKRDAVLKKARDKNLKLKSTHFVPNAPETRIYVNGHLTTYFKEPLFEAKKLKDIGYAFVWCKYGKVLARKTERGNVIQILSKSDVEKILKGNKSD
ncbi:hypothetical protein J6590_102074, partial [Homalodisca vitripennis]